MGALQMAGERPLRQTRPTPEQVKTYGNRPDGTPKGAGYFGEIANPYLPPGNFSGEKTIGINLGGKDISIPTLVPTLTTQEIRAVLQAKDAKDIPEPIVRKAVEHAKLRMQQGKPIYATPDEYSPLPKD